PIASASAPSTCRSRRMPCPSSSGRENSLPGPRAPGRNPDGDPSPARAQRRELAAELRELRRDHRRAVSLVRIALEIALVVRLGGKPFPERNDLGDDRCIEHRPAAVAFAALEPGDRLQRLAPL